MRRYSSLRAQFNPWILCILGILTLTGCDGGSPENLDLEEPQQIAWISDRPESVRWEAIRRAAAFKSEAYPFLEHLPESKSGTVPERIALATQNGADFIVLWHHQDQAPLEAITKAEDNGVEFVTLGRRILRDRASNHVIVNLPAGAERLGRDLGKFAPEHKAFVLLHYRSRDQFSKALYDRFKSGLAAQSSLTLVAEADATQKPAVETLQKMLSQFPSTKFVVTLESDVWLEPQAQRIPKDVRYATLDAPPGLWRDLVSGRAAAFIGPVDGEIAIEAISLTADLVTTTRRPIADRAVDCRIVSSETLKAFAQAYAEAVNLKAADFLE